jgi:N-acetylglucosamine kinase-like BadF-type ATPase
MKYFLGIDVGSSKTHALIADEAGQGIGFGRAGGGNHQGVGYEGLTKVLKKSFGGASMARLREDLTQSRLASQDMISHLKEKIICAIKHLGLDVQWRSSTMVQMD